MAEMGNFKGTHKNMKLSFAEPWTPLKGYIDKIWVLETDCGLPHDDMKMLVPDGRMLLLIPFRSGLLGKMGGRDYVAGEGSISVVGVGDLPSTVDAQSESALGVIGVDFTPKGAYRFFQWRLKESSNDLQLLADVLGNPVKRIEEKMAGTENIDEKLLIVQEFLFHLFTQKESDLVFEYCIEKIHTTKGAVSVRELEQQTGYSGRWLNRKFEERLGISPKNFASISRFRYYYQALLTNASRILTHKEFYHHYYDESHFIREFKRFTGMPPAKLESTVNNFGKLFL
jgi:AraC-like DNA-binding protein